MGGGFAGVACARALALRSGSKQLEITVVDAKSYQLYHPSLYEVLCTLREGVSPAAVRATAAILLGDVLASPWIRFQQAHVKYWDGTERLVYLDSGELSYDILVVALGSTSEYFGVPGAREFAWPFKTFEDATRFRNALVAEFSAKNGPVNLVVSGGGFTGVETAGELACYLRHLARTSERSGHVLIIEGCPQLLPGLDSSLALRVRRRLERLDVEVRLDSFVKRVGKDEVELSSGEEIQTKFVLWTAGVRACPLPGTTKQICGPKGRLSTDRYLRVAGFRDVYAIGDIACAVDNSGKPLPQTASLAIQQGKYVTDHILRTLARRPTKPYCARFEGYVIPAGGKYAFFVSSSGLVIEGFIGWVLRRLIDLAYWNSVLPWHKALVLWLRATRLFVKND